MHGMMTHTTSVLITAPTADVLSVADCKDMLGITSDSQDDMIEAAIGAVASSLDPATGGWLGRALRPQTWELRRPSFWGHNSPSGPCSLRIVLPYPVLTSVTSVKYDTWDGVETTLVENTDYRVFGLGQYLPAYITPQYNGVWPSARYDYESVRIRYVCGYDGDAIPKPIIQFIALQVRMLLSNVERNLYMSLETIPGVRERRWIVSEAANAQIKTAADSLLTTYRVW